eukprot:29586-Pelagococcus_subviridis.AAC.3
MSRSSSVSLKSSRDIGSDANARLDNIRRPQICTAVVLASEIIPVARCSALASTSFLASFGSRHSSPSARVACVTTPTSDAATMLRS